MALVKCSECKKQISDTAQNCPQCGAPINLEKIEENKKKENKNLIGCLGIFGGFIFAAIIIGAINSGNTKSQTADSNVIEALEEKEEEDHSFDAYVYSQQITEENLKSPSSAEFPSMSEISVIRDGNTYSIESYVDSQNSFGAEIRTNYKCKLKYENGLFYVENFNFN